MGLATTLARRSLLQRPGRTLFSVLGVAVGIGTVVAVFTLDHVTLLQRAFKGGGFRAEMEVRPSEGVADPRARLMQTPGVRDVAANFQHDVLFYPELPGEDEEPLDDAALAGGTRIQMVAIDAQAGAAIGAYIVDSGEDLEPWRGPGDRRTVLVGDTLARSHGLEAGDVIALAKPVRTPKQVCRDGAMTTLGKERTVPVPVPFTVTGILAGDGLGNKGRGNVAVIDFGSGKDLFRDAFIEPRFWVRRDPRVDVEKVERDLGRNFSFELDKSVVVGQMEDERAFRNGVRMAGLLAMVLGLYVIFHTLSMSLLERVREVAVLHALGSQRRQIARVFFLEAVIIAVLAGLLGLGGGLAFARFLLMKGITTLGVRDKPVELFHIPWDVVGPLAVIGVGIALLGSVYPLMKARRSDTVSALRGEDLGGSTGLARGFRIFTALLLVGVLPALYFAVVPVVGAADGALLGVILAGIGVLALLIALPLVVPGVVGLVCAALAGFFERTWPLAGKLAARSIQQSPSRIAASVAAIALVTAAFVGLKGMTNSLEAEVETWGAEAVESKVFVSGLPDIEIDKLEKLLLEDEDVLGIESGDARAYVPFLMIGLRPEQLAAWGPCAEDPRLIQGMRNGQGVIVSERLARHRDLGVGDQVAINTSGHGVQTFRVVGVSDEYGYFSHPDERMYGVVADVHMKRYFCLDTDTTSTIAVRLREGADHGVVEARLREVVPPAIAGNVRFEAGPEVMEFHVFDISRDFVLFDIILGLTALLAGIGVLNGQLLAALERAKELGVLRALGMTRSQVAGMVFLESAVLGVTGAALGLVVGSALTPVVVEALELISGLPLPQRSAGPFLAYIFVGALALTALAGLYPIWRMNRFDAVRAVRTG